MRPKLSISWPKIGNLEQWFQLIKAWDIDHDDVCIIIQKQYVLLCAANDSFKIWSWEKTGLKSQ